MPLAMGFPCGGWAPADRMAEDGVIPERYPLTPLPKGGYRQRTRLNVVDSDGTAILYFDAFSGGMRLTRNLCALLKGPYVLVDARRSSEEQAVAMLIEFVGQQTVRVLNVAGPRASRWEDGYAFALAVVRGVIESTGHSPRELPCDIRSFIEHAFLEADWTRIQGLIGAARLHDGTAPNARLIRCALVAARGSMEKLGYNLNLLAVDYRDVIVAGEYDVIKGKLVVVRDLAQPIE
jgi:hypothetical protein